MYDTRRDALELAIRSAAAQDYLETAHLVERAQAFHDFMTKEEDQK